MCGFAGIVRFDDQPIDAARLEAMLRHVAHRGPDGSGIHVTARCGLAHARLSIIDPADGSQPMTAPVQGQLGALSVVYNGVIYNHRELRQQLQAYGHEFHTDHSDTEVLLHGYRQWDTQLPRHLEGMFAFGIWDANQRRLFLCRDRVGKKPLYFWRRDERQFMFSSLVATLLAGARDTGAMPAIDQDALLQYLRFGYTADNTLLQGLEQLPAAHWMTVDASGKQQVQEYWRLPAVSMSDTSQGLVQAVRELLDQAVQRRLESDVPLGCFLSGGIDSSVIAAVAQRSLQKSGNEPLNTFSVAVPFLGYDESSYARTVAEHLGTKHTELVATPAANLIDDLRRIMSASGEPTADSSLLPTLWLSQAAREHVKVALSGEGGDELFGGYDRYRAMSLLARQRGLLSFVPQALLNDPNPTSLRTRLRRLVSAANASGPAAQYHSMIHLFRDEQIQALGISTQHRPTAITDWPDAIDPVKAAMRWDLTHYLQFDLLRKVDRASMLVALEVRCPMLDAPLFELASHLPASVLMAKGRPKSLLRSIAVDLLPRPIIRRPKQGFAVPIGAWFRDSLRQPLEDYLLRGPLDQLNLNRQAIELIYHEHQNREIDHSHRLFGLLQLALWLEWLKNPPATVV